MTVGGKDADAELTGMYLQRVMSARILSVVAKLARPLHASLTGY